MAKSTKSVEVLEPLELVALKNYFSKRAEAARDGARVGDGQEIDFTVRLTGAVNVGEDYSYEGATYPELVDVVAIALSVTPEKTLEAALKKKYKGLDAKERPKLEAAHLAEARKIVDAIARDKTTECRGRVTVAAKHELVHRA